ncbi:MAG: tRNA uridine-5-carboxymethylaminomethyl(34) synthesis GTPase MnmE [Desulfocapsaceae bacterium]|nr:tRNA uridine-5-carboxymethylaminomethyl(34) synthesis GTPase MnmE [Desulfocapsaceae bacterium]
MTDYPAENSTVAAISTPPGAGGIGIIRMSGPTSLQVLRSIFRPHSSKCEFRSHTLYYGNIVAPQSGKLLDEVLVVFMQSPKTYTREDVVEVHCHGSFLVLQNILECILEQGVELAEPGEFTKRAFLNGRIDLTKAEAVIDILAAKTRKGVDLAQEQLAGALYQRVESIRQVLTEMRAVIEVALDFPDEDVEIVDLDALVTRLNEEVAAPIDKLIRSADQGRIYREGVAVVIVGRPNVGKSSLLNSILQEERALVTEIPGTTRDSIEEHVDIGGLPVRIADTAGIREGADEVEELGIQRARRLVNQADIVLFMIDGAAGVCEEDRQLFATVANKPAIILINKIDLLGEDEEVELGFFPNEIPRVLLSAKEQSGMAELRQTLFMAVTGGKDQWQEEGCAPNLRHKNSLVKARSACRRIVEGLDLGVTSDLLAVDLQECLDQLGDIVGQTTTEDILDVIFEQFCLGK